MRSRRDVKKEEATRLYSEYPADMYCCSKACYSGFSAKHVSLGRQALLHFEDQDLFLRERVKVRSLVKKRRERVYSSSDEEDEEKVQVRDLGASHHRSSFAVDSLVSLNW